MQYTTLGRTGLKVSVAGLGAGGGSQLGLDRGRSDKDAIALIRLALDLGINVIDTAETYLTLDLIGQALQGVDRSSFVLSAKHHLSPYRDPKNLYPAAKIVEGLDNLLRKLRTDYVDVFHLHALTIPRIRSCYQRGRSGAPARTREGEIPFPRRDRGADPGAAAPSDAACARHRPVRCRHGRIPALPPERARADLSGHAGAQRRHHADVRGS